MHKAEPRWLIAPADKNLPVPFLKGTPFKTLDNERMQYEAESSIGKIVVTTTYKETYEMSNG